MAFNTCSSIFLLGRAVARKIYLFIRGMIPGGVESEESAELFDRKERLNLTKVQQEACECINPINM